MKSKKMFLLFAAFIFAAVAIYNIHLTQTQNLGDISLADITVMAKADGESGEPCFSWGYRNWDYFWSGVSGVDCACNDRKKVTNRCNK